MRTRKMMLYAGMIASLTMGIFISGAGQQKVEAKTKVTYTLKKGTCLLYTSCWRCPSGSELPENLI